ncbi:extracellular solute-binding protein [Histophilus somni]|uniref:extracellular solute-binding protein n=1 Tax=Histophilus somni TaxID=731 RepID=UPI00094AA1C1|nr:extracellular solute-binding protein [Histophilus somni]
MKKLTKMTLANLILLGAIQTANASDNTVYLYTWSEYVPEGLLENFTKETGIKVIASSLESNETMYAKLKTFNIALLKMGENPNTQDPKVIEKAYQELLKLRPNILVFNSDNPANTFITGETDVGLIWNGSIRVAQNAGVPIKIVYPKEGTMLWIDNLAIPATAKNVESAYKLINYLLSADVSEKLTLEIGYPTSNLNALERLPKELTENKGIFLPQEVLDRSQWQVDVGEAAELYETYYQKLKNMQ